MDDRRELDVRPWEFSGPVEKAFELNRAPVSAIIGPTGGGKSTGSARRCLRIATWQEPSPRDRVRRARTVCICPTYRRAWDTVMPSYFKVFPQSLGDFRGSRGDPADHIFETEVNLRGERSRLHVEVLFRAVNDLDVEEFFRGFEFTAVWLPEADTNNDLAAILSIGSNRAGRYPEPDDRPDIGPEGAALAYKGIWCDANAPVLGTHFHDRFYRKLKAAGEPAPATDQVFIQPSGFSPNAENIQNLRKIDPNFYAAQAAQLDRYDVDRLLKNKPGPGRHGQAVHPNFDYETHVATQTIPVDPFSPVYIGVDCGSGSLIPGAVFYQRAYSGQWRAMAEIHLSEGQMNTDELAAELRRIMVWRFAKASGALLCLDPAAGSRNPMVEFTTAQALQHLTGIEAQLAPTNDPKHRRSALDKLLKRMVGPKDPAFIIDPACDGLIQALAGGFHYRRRGNVISPTPDKGRFSHVAEAAEYAPLTVDGLDATEGRFIRPDGERGQDAPTVIYAD